MASLRPIAAAAAEAVRAAACEIPPASRCLVANEAAPRCYRPIQPLGATFSAEEGAPCTTPILAHLTCRPPPPPQPASDAKFSDYKPTTAFFFPGQGAQSVGMAKVRGGADRTAAAAAAAAASRLRAGRTLHPHPRPP